MPVQVREGVLLQVWFAMTPQEYARAAQELLRLACSADAVRHAEAAARCCFAFRSTEQLEGRVALADAYAATGAKAEACATYELVRKFLAASPSAASFRRATKQRRALACDGPNP